MIAPIFLLKKRALGVAIMASVVLLPSAVYSRQVQQITEKNVIVLTKRQAWNLYAKLHTASTMLINALYHLCFYGRSHTGGNSRSMPGFL